MTKPAVYEHFDKAFAQVSAYLITEKAGGPPIAKVAIKYPKDGAGRLWAYCHFFGETMTRGMAGGYGYDKASAAVSTAASQWDAENHRKWIAESDQDRDDLQRTLDAMERLRLALIADDGRGWQRAATDAGFDVWSAI